jgi:mono/diheme cytochrome c family protein
MKTRLLLLAVLSLASGALRAGGSPPPSDDQAVLGAADVDLKDEARIGRGKSTFNESCAAFCHGQEPRLFVGRKGLDPDYVYQTIKEGGRGATPMPPWGNVFTPDEIWDLVAYVEFMGTLPPLTATSK